MGKVAYLCRRKGSSSYYFRCKIPVDLLDHYAPKKEVIRSLRTPERIEALSRVKIEALKQDQEFAEARRRLAQEPRHGLSDVEIERLAAIWLHDALKEDEAIRMDGLGGDKVFAAAKEQIVESGNGSSPWSDADLIREGGGLTNREYEQQRQSLEIVLTALKENYARGKTAFVEEEVDELLESEGINLDKKSDTYRRLAHTILKTEIKACESKINRHSGEVVDTPPEPQHLLSHQSFSDNSITLSALFEKWKEERKPPEKTASDFGAQIRRFIELHGDMPVSSINKTHVREFKDTLLKLPARPPKNRQGLTITKLIEMTEKDESIPRLSSKTVNEKSLGALNAILNWAVNNGYIDNNPATGIRVATGKIQTTARLPYSIDDLNLIFNFTIFTKGDRPKAGAGEAAIWLPLLAVFTGARLEELGQLKNSDVKEENDILFFDMTTIEDGKTYKTQSSRRRVPIHSKLIELGFLKYIEEQKAQLGVSGDTALLFPSLKSERGKLTAAWSKWWGRYARENGIMDKRKVFHSFRHTVKDAFRDNGVSESISDAIQGHAPRHVGGMYGSGYSLTILADAVAKLQYPGLHLPTTLKFSV